MRQLPCERRKTDTVASSAPDGRPALASVQIPGKERHCCGSDRHEARAHLAVQQPLGDDRADADAHREERQHHRHHLLVREEHVLGKRRQPRHHGGAKQPEP